ncbi:MAG: tRNA (cmo5U34)-methyltransferase, partial [Nitrospinae bacterium]|nr:tRNA (cmo5U34)-methyltransferase [Nitrospinota bacterium]
KGVKQPWELIEADIEKELEMANASVVIMNYTLQFISPRRRKAMVKKIFDALNPGGCLILIEKVKAESEDLEELFTGRHHEFKREKGYSKMEVSKKRDALDQVLVPLKLSDNIRLLEKTGFRHPEVFFKWMNFAGLIAVKRRGRPRSK